MIGQKKLWWDTDHYFRTILFAKNAERTLLVSSRNMGLFLKKTMADLA